MLQLLDLNLKLKVQLQLSAADPLFPSVPECSDRIAVADNAWPRDDVTDHLLTEADSTGRAEKGHQMEGAMPVKSSEVIQNAEAVQVWLLGLKRLGAPRRIAQLHRQSAQPPRSWLSQLFSSWQIGHSRAAAFGGGCSQNDSNGVQTVVKSCT
jgi:hypothetical protein